MIRDNWQNLWVPKGDGRMKVDCTFKTAVEDVTEVAAIAEYFQR